MDINTKMTLRKQMKVGDKIQATEDSNFDSDDVLTIEEVLAETAIATSSKNFHESGRPQRQFISRGALKLGYERVPESSEA